MEFVLIYEDLKLIPSRNMNVEGVHTYILNKSVKEFFAVMVYIISSLV
jgi:hypothetical protein